MNGEPIKGVRIDVFRAEHAAAFEALNRGWLLDHGLYEAPDEAQLSNPWGTIIEPGGQIFVALRGDEALGTCAVIPHQTGIFELAKLAVAPQGWGQRSACTKAWASNVALCPRMCPTQRPMSIWSST